MWPPPPTGTFKTSELFRGVSLFVSSLGWGASKHDLARIGVCLKTFPFWALVFCTYITPLLYLLLSGVFWRGKRDVNHVATREHLRTVERCRGVSVSPKLQPELGWVASKYESAGMRVFKKPFWAFFSVPTLRLYSISFSAGAFCAGKKVCGPRRQQEHSRPVSFSGV